MAKRISFSSWRTCCAHALVRGARSSSSCSRAARLAWRPTRACGRSTTRRVAQLKRQVRLHADHRVAGPPASVERALQRRRVRLVCQPARSGADEPPRGARPAAEGVDAPEELRRRRVLREERVGRVEVPGPRAERARLDGECHRARAERGPARRRRRASARSAQESDCRPRRGEQQGDRTAVRRRVALPEQRVLAVSVQEVHGRPAGVRARAVDRVLRRRSRQLHLSALRLRRGAVPRLRERRAQSRAAST